MFRYLFPSPCPERTCPMHTSNIRSTKSHIHFLSLRSFIQRICPGPRLLMNFRKKAIFLRWGIVYPTPNPKLEDHPLSAVCDCLFNIFAGTLHCVTDRSWITSSVGWTEQFVTSSDCRFAVAFRVAVIDMSASIHVISQSYGISNYEIVQCDAYTALFHQTAEWGNI
jgi:hypothetical protein